ncbi:MAG TPA: IS607 family transposase [Caldithrix sp.]|nr:IS607 family transposase [Caldithrix sp.]
MAISCKNLSIFKLRKIDMINAYIKENLPTLDIMLRISDAASFLGVSKGTLRRWDRQKILTPVRTPGNHRRYSLHQLRHVFTSCKEEACKNSEETHILCYARVSSHKQKQKGDLLRQMNTLKEHAFQEGDTKPICIQDVGSGLNPRRSGLQKIFKLVKSGTIAHILVTYTDRLTRFGFPFIQHYCDLFNVSIVELSQPTEKSVQQSLVDDMMTLIACFSGKLYGLRSAKRRKRKSVEALIEKTIHHRLSRATTRAIKQAVARILAI